MKLTCPRCGSENQFDETKDAGARLGACLSCGADLHAPAAARRADTYDGYAVGRRVLKAVPAWALLCLAGFVVVLLVFKWASRPVGRAGAEDDEFRNEATNRTPPTPSPPDSRADAKPSNQTREDARREAETPTADESGAQTAKDDTRDERGARGVGEEDEAASFSVQAGAFDDRSQANELVSRLRAAGFDARVVEAEASKRFRFQVRTGLFRTREDAARLAAQLRSKGVQTVVVDPAK
ncbi:MAG TPA: SPOR domain-containing protein [Pyrinomonadaceae bacterium]|nr:SPOR domain-containing protein [Pyrinomonadaceae bacterium]